MALNIKTNTSIDLFKYVSTMIMLCLSFRFNKHKNELFSCYQRFKSSKPILCFNVYSVDLAYHLKLVIDMLNCEKRCNAISKSTK